MYLGHQSPGQCPLGSRTRLPEIKRAGKLFIHSREQR
jgi:hypothetical protein